jgi:hypothetical protein
LLLSADCQTVAQQCVLSPVIAITSKRFPLASPYPPSRYVVPPTLLAIVSALRSVQLLQPAMFLVPVERRAILSLFGSIDSGATVAAEPPGKLAASLIFFLRETPEPLVSSDEFRQAFFVDGQWVIDLSRSDTLFSLLDVDRRNCLNFICSFFRSLRLQSFPHAARLVSVLSGALIRSSLSSAVNAVDGPDFAEAKSAFLAAQVT